MGQKDNRPEVGPRIRALREQQGFSLRALAERCGLSLNAVSHIERGENSPTVASLHLLATALGVPITEFFQDVNERSVVHVRSSRRTHTRRREMDIESLGVGLREQQMEPFLITLEPDANSGSDLITHSGQEFVFCLEGEVLYEIGTESYPLESGDSLLFEAKIPHRFKNAGDAPARMVLVFQSRDGSPDARQRHLSG